MKSWFNCKIKYFKEDENGSFNIGEIMLADISEAGSIISVSKTTKLSENNYFKALRQRVEPGDVIFSFKGTIGKVGFIDDSIFDLKRNFDDIFVSQALLILRSKDIEQSVLFEYLSSPTILGYINTLAGGNATKNLATKDLRTLPVLEADTEILQEIRNSFENKRALGEEMRRLQIKLNEMKERNWPDNSL